MQVGTTAFAEFWAKPWNLGFSMETVKFLEIHFKNNVLFSSLVLATQMRSNQ